MTTYTVIDHGDPERNYHPRTDLLVLFAGSTVPVWRDRDRLRETEK